MGETGLSERAAERRPDASVVCFSTADYAPRDRLAACREIYGRALINLEIEPIETEAFKVDARTRRLTGLSTVIRNRSAALYRYSRGQPRNDDIFLTLPLIGGFEATQRGRSASMGPGDAILGTGAEPLDFRVSSSCRSLTLCFPRRAIASSVIDLDAAFGCRIPAETPALRLLTHYVGSVEEVAAVASPDVQRHAVTHVHDLIALALGATRDAAEVAKLRGVRAARLRAIKAEIEENLHRNDLSVATVAARHRLPVRYVQRLFEEDGVTFTRFVLEQRLARARQILINPRLVHFKMSTVAIEAGFSSMPYFHEAFRRRYGVSPSDMRAQAQRDN